MALLVVTRDPIELEAFGRVCGKTLGRTPTAVVHDADPRLPLHAGILGAAR